MEREGGGHYSSICVLASMSEAEHHKEGFKSTKSQKHLRVKSENMEKMCRKVETNRARTDQTANKQN